MTMTQTDRQTDIPGYTDTDTDRQDRHTHTHTHKHTHYSNTM